MKLQRLKSFYIKKKIDLDTEMDSEGVDTSAIGDLSFLLLIFFIVTSSFLLKQGLPFSLPAKDAKPQRIEENKIIKIRPTENAFFYKGKVLSREKMSNVLLKSANQNTKIVVLIQMKNHILYDRFIDTLSLVKENRITQISVEEI